LVQIKKFAILRRSASEPIRLRGQRSGRCRLPAQGNETAALLVVTANSAALRQKAERSYWP
jgi:hypothetical protein